MSEDHRTLLVADSFRARTDPVDHVTEVRGFWLHLDRFRDGVLTVLEDRLEAQADDDANEDWLELTFEPFMQTVAEQIDRGGKGFPRIELLEDDDTGELSLNVRHRPLPQLGSTIQLRSTPSSGLTAVRVKGPNIARFAELNRTLGAETLLLDGDDRVVEGTTTSIVWWQDNTLCVSASAERVGSITELLLVSTARHDGVPVTRASATLAELQTCEVWAVNALHGIRVVTDIDGVAMRTPEARRLRGFRGALDCTWEPVLPI